MKNVNIAYSWSAQRCLDLNGDRADTPRKLPVDFTFKVRFHDICVRSIQFSFMHVPHATIRLSKEDEDGIEEYSELMFDHTFFQADDIYENLQALITEK